MRRAVRLIPVVTLAFVVSTPAADRLVPGKLPTGEMLLPNGRLLTPTGTQTEVVPYPFALALTPGGQRVVVACTRTTRKMARTTWMRIGRSGS